MSSLSDCGESDFYGHSSMNNASYITCLLAGLHRVAALVMYVTNAGAQVAMHSDGNCACVARDWSAAGGGRVCG